MPTPFESDSIGDDRLDSTGDAGAIETIIDDLEGISITDLRTVAHKVSAHAVRSVIERYVDDDVRSRSAQNVADDQGFAETQTDLEVFSAFANVSPWMSGMSGSADSV